MQLGDSSRWCPLARQTTATLWGSFQNDINNQRSLIHRLGIFFFFTPSPAASLTLSFLLSHSNKNYILIQKTYKIISLNTSKPAPTHLLKLSYQTYPSSYQAFRNSAITPLQSWLLLTFEAPIHYELKLASLDVNKRFKSCVTLLQHSIIFSTKKQRNKAKKKESGIHHVKPFFFFVLFQKKRNFFNIELKLSHPQGYIRSEDADSKKKLQSDLGSVFKVILWTKWKWEWEKLL